MRSFSRLAAALILAAAPRLVSAQELRRTDVGTPAAEATSLRHLPSVQPLTAPPAATPAPSADDLWRLEYRGNRPATTQDLHGVRSAVEQAGGVVLAHQAAPGWTVSAAGHETKMRDVLANPAAQGWVISPEPPPADLERSAAASRKAVSLMRRLRKYLADNNAGAEASLLADPPRGATAPNVIAVTLPDGGAGEKINHYERMEPLYRLLQAARERFPGMPKIIEINWSNGDRRWSRYRDHIPSPGTPLTPEESRRVLTLLKQSRAPIAAYLPIGGSPPFPGALYHYFDKDPTSYLEDSVRDVWTLYRRAPRVKLGESLLAHSYYLLWTGP